MTVGMVPASARSSLAPMPRPAGSTAIIPHMRIAIGADHAGFVLKQHLVGVLQALGHDVDDRGTHSEASVDYPEVCAVVGREVVSGRADRGIVLGGSGRGSRLPRTRCAACARRCATTSIRRGCRGNTMTRTCSRWADGLSRQGWPTKSSSCGSTPLSKAAAINAGSIRLRHSNAFNRYRPA